MDSIPIVGTYFIRLFRITCVHSKQPHLRLLSRLLSLNTLCCVRHTEQTFARNELAGSLADAISLVLNTHQRHLKILDKLELMSCQTLNLLL